MMTFCAWLCQPRRDWPAVADVWRLRQRWLEDKGRLRAELLAGTYEVGLLSRVTLQDGTEVDMSDCLTMDSLLLTADAQLVRGA